MFRKSTSIVVLSIAIALLTSVFVFAEVAKPWETIDFNGQTLRIHTRWNNLTPLGPRGAFLWNEPDGRLQAHINEVEEMFNVKIRFSYRK